MCVLTPLLENVFHTTCTSKDTSPSQYMWMVAWSGNTQYGVEQQEGHYRLLGWAGWGQPWYVLLLQPSLMENLILTLFDASYILKQPSNKTSKS